MSRLRFGSRCHSTATWPGPIRAGWIRSARAPNTAPVVDAPRRSSRARRRGCGRDHENDAPRPGGELRGDDHGPQHVRRIRGPGTRRWNGWWGEPAVSPRVFVLTHHARPPMAWRAGRRSPSLPRPESALEQARDGGRAIWTRRRRVGRAAVPGLGLVDELEINVVPALLGTGERLFENLDGPPSYLKPLEVLSSPRAAHFRFVRD